MTDAHFPNRPADGYHALVTAERLTLRIGGRLFAAEDNWLRTFFYHHDDPSLLTVEFLGHYAVIVDRIARQRQVDPSEVPQVQPELGLVTITIGQITITANIDEPSIVITTDGNPADLPDEFRRYFQLRRLP